jgi:replicative DNA helicase
MSYLAELTDIVPTTANVYEYAQIVKNKAVLRNLLKCGNEIIAC